MTKKLILFVVLLTTIVTGCKKDDCAKHKVYYHKFEIKIIDTVYISSSNPKYKVKLEILPGDTLLEANEGDTFKISLTIPSSISTLSRVDHGSDMPYYMQPSMTYDIYKNTRFGVHVGLNEQVDSFLIEEAILTGNINFKSCK